MIRAKGRRERGGFHARLLAAALVLLTLSSSAWAQVPAHPLEPPDLSSPRATLAFFHIECEQAYKQLKGGGGRTRENLAMRRAAIARITRCFDLEAVAPSLRTNVARESAVCLKEVMDRIELPEVSDIPDAEAVAAVPGGLAKWTIPHTEITLVRIANGPRAGQYVFSAETAERANDYYELVKSLPYKPGAAEGLYDYYVSQPGWLIPREWIEALPAWAKMRIGHQVAWQWFGLAAALVTAAMLVFHLYRMGFQQARAGRGAGYYFSVLYFLLAMLVPLATNYFLEHGLFLTGTVRLTIEFTLNLIFLGTLSVIIAVGANRLATATAHSRWFKSHSVNAQVTQLLIRVGGVGSAIAVLIEGGRQLGVPLATLIAGVSVSGLAVALAAQDSIRNLFGSFMIVIDKPFEVGDRIKIKGYEGTIESIGLRSSRLRLSSGHLVAIANDEMARLDSENISRRDHLRRTESFRLKADTPPATVLRAVEIVREALRDHEGMDPAAPATVYANSFGPDSIVITMTYWYHPPDPQKFDAFNQAINLRLLEKFQAEGIRFL